ncbi:hypothetical protein CONPUDRAFT_82807 [Coniophora puteana RWD-64-598 SS2]|uniref:Uncharacterized protein n=1 Tax=Coniophora puteana (strain RWD-64-598) TaxID=741705 RepID=A0A5M3MPS5_CONPW|nr:uncharacterized protein CONPUDRAFT_82807 [Coniophora puteana RWD-64-598 SS2]EIW80704.1 hypothetical protein CONPUDRAFT_82807 [Coniophora puteana RWD-64-598 SS2]
MEAPVYQLSNAPASETSPGDASLDWPETSSGAAASPAPFRVNRGQEKTSANADKSCGHWWRTMQCLLHEYMEIPRRNVLNARPSGGRSHGC